VKIKTGNTIAIGRSQPLGRYYNNWELNHCNIFAHNFRNATTFLFISITFKRYFFY